MIAKYEAVTSIISEVPGRVSWIRTCTPTVQMAKWKLNKGVDKNTYVFGDAIVYFFIVIWINMSN